jgi:hypothetical protein
LVYHEERNDFKGKRVISFELKDRVYCQLNQVDLASAEEKNVSLGRLSPHHLHATTGKSEIYQILRKYPLYLAYSSTFYF